MPGQDPPPSADERDRRLPGWAARLEVGHSDGPSSQYGHVGPPQLVDRRARRWRRPYLLFRHRLSMLAAPPEFRRVCCYLAAVLALGCSDRLDLGSDLLWRADHEAGDLGEWTASASGDTRLPSSDSSVAISAEAAHGGLSAVELRNPADWDNADEGPELFHTAGQLGDAYYSAWFLLPEQYHIEPTMTLVRLRSREPGGGELYNGEELQLRSVSSGGYVLLVFSNNSGFLLEPVAAAAPLIRAGRWFQLEARYEPQSSGRLRVWLDGQLSYDLVDRPGATSPEIVFSVCNVAERSTPAPLRLFVDDAAISLSRVSPSGQL